MFLALLLIAPALAGYEPDPNALRAEVPADARWDLGPLFADDAAWASAADAAEEEVARVEAWKGRLADPRALRECLDHYFATYTAVNRVTLYASLRQATAETDPAALAMDERAQSLMSELSGQSAYIRTEVLSLTEKQVERAFRKEPGLAPYRRYLDGFARRRSRVLHPEAERVLALLGDNLWLEIDLNEVQADPERAFRALLGDIPWPVVQDAEGKDVTLNLTAYADLRASPDRPTRERAVAAFFAALRQYQDAFAATLAGQARLDVAFARARHYDSALEAYLDKDEIDRLVYENLVNTIGANLAPLHRYVALRKKALGVDKVHLSDMYVPVVPGVEKDVPYDEARRTVVASLAPLGTEYVAAVEKGMAPEGGWIDVYPSREKSAGGFCASTYGVHPYVLLNHLDTMDDMFTLAHEMGHAMHSHYSMQAQPPSQWSYPPFLAEIASTANESLLLDHLLATTTDPDQRIYLLNQRVDGIKGTIYRQAMLSEFEWKVHRFVEEGTPVTAKLLDETYREIALRYYGPDYEVGPDEGMEWAYIRHFYYKYYLFNYATGLSSGLAVARRVKDGGPEARAAWLELLGGGSSAPPLDQLRRAGVDLTGPGPILDAVRLFDESRAELERLLDERSKRGG